MQLIKGRNMRRILMFGAVLLIAGAQPSWAQVTVDAAKITCEQWVFSKVAPPRTIAVWLSGYYNGKRNETTLDLQKLEGNGRKVERFCRQEKNFQMPVMQAIEQVLAPKQ